MVLTAACVSFAHGGNDVANAVGPLNEVLLGLMQKDSLSELWFVPILGGIAIVLGLVIYGAKVMRTVGEKITKLSYSAGFCAQFGGAVAVLVATDMGLPISTTAVLIGAITGVGLSEGSSNIDVRMIFKIVAGWIITLPCAGVMSLIVFLIAKLGLN